MTTLNLSLSALSSLTAATGSLFFHLIRFISALHHPTFRRPLPPGCLSCLTTISITAQPQPQPPLSPFRHLAPDRRTHRPLVFLGWFLDSTFNSAFNQTGFCCPITAHLHKGDIHCVFPFLLPRHSYCGVCSPHRNTASLPAPGSTPATPHQRQESVF